MFFFSKENPFIKLSAMMPSSTGRAVINKGFKEDELTSSKPMQLKATGKHAEEDKGRTKREDDSENLYENLECEKSIKPQSNRRFVWLAIVACLISIVALLLALLILSGNIGYGCDCSENEGKFYSLNSFVFYTISFGSY